MAEKTADTAGKHKRKSTAKKAAPKGAASAVSRGRPSKFNTVDMDKARKLAEKGWTDAEMADFFGIDQSTWHRWKDANPEFCKSLKDWKEEADRKVERSLYERACGYSHPEDKIFNANGVPLVVPTTKHYPPDATSMIFWLKNRQPERWRDQPGVGNSSDEMAKVFAAAAEVMRESA